MRALFHFGVVVVAITLVAVGVLLMLGSLAMDIQRGMMAIAVILLGLGSIVLGGFVYVIAAVDGLQEELEQLNKSIDQLGKIQETAAQLLMAMERRSLKSQADMTRSDTPEG